MMLMLMLGGDCVVAETLPCGCPQACKLNDHDMAVLWEHLGGDEAYVESKLPHLLCRYRTGLLAGKDDVRLKAFLSQHWTLDGPCFDQQRFPKMSCPKEVRESHRQLYG